MDNLKPNEIYLKPLIISLLNSCEIPNKHTDTIDKLYGREYVRRLIHKSTDKFELSFNDGLLILGVSKIPGSLSVYNVMPSKSYTKKLDVIQPLMSPEITHIIVVDGITAKVPSTLWKITIKH